MKRESDKKSHKIKMHPDWKWISTIFGTTIGISAAMSFLSSEVLSTQGMAVSFIVLLFIVMLGIVFDVIGVAVTAADEKPFHAMASKKRPEAATAIHMLRRADRVSSFCNDVVGDICGVLSGSASAVIAARAVADLSSAFWSSIIKLLMSALVAGVTVGGKAFGKTLAMNNSTQIIHAASVLIYSVKSFPKRVMLLFKKH